MEPTIENLARKMREMTPTKRKVMLDEFAKQELNQHLNNVEMGVIKLQAKNPEEMQARLDRLEVKVNEIELFLEILKKGNERR